MATLLNPVSVQAGNAERVAAGRLISLDFFRGATIAAMILVNNPGDGPVSYWPLQHSAWNGWTPTDLVFPFFLFIVGVAMPFSFASRAQRGQSRGALLRHVLWRGVFLFALGLLVNGFPNHFAPATLRVYGVLQRIAICYVISAFLALWTGRRTQILVMGSCLIGYWILMRYVPVPGFGIPTHGFTLLDPDRNIAAWLDRKLLLGHLYEGTRDPEGLLSTIPALATSLIGLLTGDWLRSERSPRAKALGMVLYGAAGFAAGEFFNRWFPINKKLWTSSYVLLTAGLALVCLAACYWVLDIKRRASRWAWPFLVLGTNAIAAYILSELVAAALDAGRIAVEDGAFMTWHEVLYREVCAPLASPTNSSLLYALVYTVGCWVAIWVLNRKKIFLKV